MPKVSQLFQNFPGHTVFLQMQENNCLASVYETDMKNTVDLKWLELVLESLGTKTQAADLG